MPATLAKNKHKGWQLPARVPPAMKKILKEYAVEQRRSVSSLVLILLERILQIDGKWPPPTEKKGGADQ